MSDPHDFATTTPGTPAITVLIVSSGRSALLASCLRRVRAQAGPLDGEVVVVINDSAARLPSETAESLRTLVDRLDFEPRVGKSHALNHGVAISRGAVVAFTDDDALPQEGWLESITGPLLDPRRPSDLVGCGGRVLPVFSVEVPAWYDRLTARQPTHFLGPKHDLGDAPVHYSLTKSDRHVPLGANCAYLRDVLLRNPYLEELGPNRRTGLRGGEDTEIGFRLLRAGRRILYCPDARVEHPVTTDRLTLDYVRRGYYLQGVEKARIQHALGRRTSLVKLLSRLMRRTLRVRLDRAGDSPAVVRRLMRLERISGELSETVRLRYPEEVFPDHPDLGAIWGWGVRRIVRASRPGRRDDPGSEKG